MRSNCDNHPAGCDRSMKRIEWLDDIKGVAITLIVAGHVVATLANMTMGCPQMAMRRVFDAIYSFHVPLFFVIAGWFSLRFIRREEDTGGYCRLLSALVLAYIAIVNVCPNLGMLRWDRPEINLSLYYTKWFLKAIPTIALLIVMAKFKMLRMFAFLSPMSLGIMLFHKYPLVVCQLAIGRSAALPKCGVVSVCVIALLLTGALAMCCYAISLLVVRLAPWSLGVRRK